MLPLVVLSFLFEDLSFVYVFTLIIAIFAFVLNALANM